MTKQDKQNIHALNCLLPYFKKYPDKELEVYDVIKRIENNEVLSERIDSILKNLKGCVPELKDSILLIPKEPVLEYFEDPDDVLTPVKEVKTITPLTKAQAAYADTVEKTDLEKMSEDYANEVQKMRMKEALNFNKHTDNTGAGFKDPNKVLKIDPVRWVDEARVGKKESEGKLFYELDWEFITFMAEVMAKNKGSKYPPFNWKNKIDIEGLRQALIRHTMAIAKDEFDDDGTELGHLASIALNSMMMWYQKKNYK